ncbi:MAG: phosphate/phosphite/phosphonate ABC transporter substrate-binding protein [Chloroflexota bacterium]|nr:phosphate/phosphite/phosphonate ABC transporter substrate-binding protein [Chloroflexota bacterium]
MARLRPHKLLASFIALLTLGTVSAAVVAQSEATPASPPEYDRTGWPETMECGLFGGDDAEAALDNAEPLAAYLEAWLGMPVNYTTGTSYNAVIESMRAGHTNCGTTGPFSYILAVQEAGAEALAIGVSTRAEPPVFDPSLTPAYYSVISVKKGSGINTIEDLRDRSFSFVDPASTSGHLIPKAYLLNQGVDPDTEMQTVFSGSHPTSAIALWNDKVDAAVSTETTLYNLAAEGQIDFCGFEDGQVGKERSPEDLQALFDACPDGSLAMLAMSDPIPSTPFAVDSELPDSLKRAVKDALLATPDNPEFIAATGRWYVDPNIDQDLGLAHLDNYYDPLREVARLLDLDLQSLE